MKIQFQSRWRGQFARFVRFKQTLGFPYRRGIATLRSFDRYAAAISGSGSFETVLRTWIGRSGVRKPASISNELCVMRQFCLFRRRDDPGAFVPGRECAPPSTTGAPFLPHIFSPEQISRILADTVRISGSPRTRACFRVLITVLYCTGVRVGEALALKVRDVDLRQRCLRVGPGKGRVRWVPFHADLARVLDGWMRTRGPCSSPDEPFFSKDDGKARRVKNVSQTLMILFRRLGIKPRLGRTGPRCHDFRHTFAVHRLQRWYQEGRDLQRMLPWLSAYLGHVNLLGTERYLHATPELLATASRRLRRHLFAKNTSS